MFSSLESKFILVLGVVIALMGGLGYLYFNYAQGQISTLTSNNAKLNDAVKLQTAAINSLQSAMQKQNAALSTLQTQSNTAETQRRALENQFNTNTIASQAATNRAQTETKMNLDTSGMFKDIETTTQGYAGTGVVTPPPAPKTGSNAMPPPAPPKGSK